MFYQIFLICFFYITTSDIMGKILHVLPIKETNVQGKRSISRDYLIADRRLQSIFYYWHFHDPFEWYYRIVIIILFLDTSTVCDHYFLLFLIKLNSPMDLLLLPSMNPVQFLLLLGSKSQRKTVSIHISLFRKYFYKFSFHTAIFLHNTRS